MIENLNINIDISNIVVSRRKAKLKVKINFNAIGDLEEEEKENTILSNTPVEFRVRISTEGGQHLNLYEGIYVPNDETTGHSIYQFSSHWVSQYSRAIDMMEIALLNPSIYLISVDVKKSNQEKFTMQTARRVILLDGMEV